MNKDIFIDLNNDIVPWDPIPLYDNKNKILLDWSAKGGSVLVVSMFFDNMGLLGAAHKHSCWIHDYRCQVFQKRKKSPYYPVISKSQILSSEIYKIKVVRNPFTRAVSSYCHAMRTNICKKHSLDNNTTFIDFLKYIVSSEEVDIHWERQKRDIECEYNDFFDAICQIENIVKSINFININAGTSFDYLSQRKKTLHSHHIERNEQLSMSIADCPWSKLDIDNLPSYRCFYDSASRSLVEQYYGDDIISYGYSFGDV